MQPEDNEPSADHESRLVQAFVRAEQRDRYLSLLANPRKRGTILGRLAHSVDLDARFVQPIPAADHTPERIARILAARGAPERCHMVSENPSLDGREMPLGEALRAVVGYGQGTIISCVPGRLAFYESGEPRQRFILQRPATPG